MVETSALLVDYRILWVLLVGYRSSVNTLSLTVSLVVPLPCLAGPAVNQFEVKDLEIELGQWEFQSQNAHSWSQPRRRHSEENPGEFVYDDNSVVRQRHALEIEVGTFSWMRNRLGIEFEKARFEDPERFAMRDDFDSLRLEEIAAEAVVVFVPVDRIGVGVGMLVEYQRLFESDEADSFVFGPIIETTWDAWSIVLNPAFVQFFGGEQDDDKLDFTYAAHILHIGNDPLDLGLEFYGTIDRIGSSGSRGEEAALFGDHDLHRLGPAAYYRHAFGEEDQKILTLGLGMFFGLNEATPDYTLKWSVEFEF